MALEKTTDRWGRPAYNYSETEAFIRRGTKGEGLERCWLVIWPPVDEHDHGLRVFNTLKAAEEWLDSGELVS